ncbi:family 5 putative carbohydrate esterase [Rhypophila decipiens]|uniref:Cutinase n=1 Tax=Rhypophila decipiens TaxID=261697 RepID=A0AAN6Y772_9PEZI|nr:family 5 putative carbohydrate esterase [Rhypophila decipiens]
MMFLAPLALLAGLVAALPNRIEELRSLTLLEEATRTQALEARQTSGQTRNELTAGGACPPIIFIWARGSTEPGNMGTLGPFTADVLEATYGAANVWIQGVGGNYKANLLDNILPDGTTSAAITEMKNLFSLANSRCPGAKVVAGGYSQGAALAAAAIRDTSAAIREQIKAVVLFGYTKNKQNNGGVPNYPQSRVAVYCADGDLVCTGTLIVTPAHTTYADEASGPAPAFLIARINAS